jgi:putative membrane protein
MWYMHDFGGWWMWIGGIFMFLFWGGLIALVIWGVNRFTERDKAVRTHTPIDVAKERYARGEISREEFDQIRKDLS